MFNITNIPQLRVRTRERRDADGKLVRTKEEYWGVRPVKVVTGFDRFLHYLLDGLIIGAVQTLIAGLLALVSTLPSAFGVTAIMGFALAPTGWLVAFAYYTFFEWRSGTTPGKMVFARAVLTKKGTAPDLQSALVRSLIRFVPFEAFSCFADRGWHDQWSDTYVVTKAERDAILTALADANQKAAEYHAQHQPQT